MRQASRRACGRARSLRAILGNDLRPGEFETGWDVPPGDPRKSPAPKRAPTAGAGTFEAVVKPGQSALLRDPHFSWRPD